MNTRSLVRIVKGQLRALLVLLVLLVSAIGLRGQQTNGTILGTVADSSGAVVPNAQITITNQDTGAVRNVVTSNDGAYDVPEVPAGLYAVRATVTGFSPVETRDVQVIVASNTRVDLKVQIGGVTQTVTVSEAAPLVETSTSSVGSVVNEQSVTDLPLNGRNWTDLTLMQPGIAQANVFAPGSVGIGTNGTDFSSNGATLRSNYVSLDGANLENLAGFNNGSITNTSLGVDGIKEYKVLTSMFTAEYGIRMGSQTTIVSKGGTNEFHGDAFEYLRNSSLDARNYFDALDTANVNGFGTNKSLVYADKRLPPFRRNDFGGAFGGPIKRDKTFFFGVYEGIRQEQGLSVADQSLPAACFVDPTGAVHAQVPAQIKNVNQLGTCASGAASTITVNHYILPLADLFPFPNVTGTPTFNYTHAASEPSPENYGQMRVDHVLSTADTIFARFTHDAASTVTTTGAFMGGTTTGYPGYNVYYSSSDYWITFGENHVFTPSLLNSFRFSWSRTNHDSYEALTPSLCAPDVTFVPGNPVCIGAIGPGSGVTQIGAGGNAIGNAVQDIWSWSDDIYWTKGKHAFKFGMLLNHFLINPWVDYQVQGEALFGSLTNFFNADYSTLEEVAPGSQAAFSMREDIDGFYAQDDYRVRSRLTLNLGLRYEFTTVPKERNPGESSYVRSVYNDTGTPGNMFVNNTLHNFSPRIGLAWDVTGKGTTAVRAGFGVYYDVGAYADMPLVVGISNPPVSYGYQLNNSAAIPQFPFTVPFSLTGSNVPVTPREADYNMQQPTLAQYNLTVEQKLPWQMALSVGYLGSHGWHLFQVREADHTIAAGTGTNGLPYYGCWNAAQTSYILPSSNGSCPTAFDNIPPRINPFWGGFQLDDAEGLSYYNSLQALLTKRLAQGLQFQFAYTYSKSIDTGEGELSGERVTEGNELPYGLNERFDRGPSAWDSTHNIRANFIYHAPEVRGNNFTGKVLNGWWISSIISAQSGYPVTPILGSDRELQGSSYTFERPNVDPSFNRNTVITGTPAQWFNPTMFDVPVVGTFGNEGKGMLRGPGFENLDFSLVKDTKVGFLGEQGRVELRGEVFNVLNHPNFALPNATIWSASGAVATAPAGQIQRFGTTGAALTANSTTGQIAATVNSSRQIQLALKVIW